MHVESEPAAGTCGGSIPGARLPADAQRARVELRWAASLVHLPEGIDAIKDLVTDVSIDATPNGISLQAMDSSHVALVSLTLG